MSAKNKNPLRRSLLSENILNMSSYSINSKRKNLLLRSLDSINLKSVPIEETLEDALVDLYLSVKIRSNEEVSFLTKCLDWRVWRQNTWKGKAETRSDWSIYHSWIHQVINWDPHEYEEWRTQIKDKYSGSPTISSQR